MSETTGKKYIIDNPKLMAEWNWEKNNELGFDPKALTIGSGQKVWWKCNKCSYEWEANPNHRSRGRSCPSCAKKLRASSRIKIFIDNKGCLFENNPKLAKEWHPTKNGDLTPRDVTLGSSKKIWWQCAKGHEWQAVISSRRNGVGCPICSGKKVLVGFNDLATINPELAKEWHSTKNGDLTPKDVTIGSEKKVWWQCVKGHEWQTTIAHRTEGTGCPYCSGKKVIVGYNDLVTKKPELAKEWNYARNGELKPESFLPNSNKKVWWKCSKGHEWQSTINNRRINGCPQCSKELKTSFPEQVIFYYLSQVTDAINRYVTENKSEIDIYLPKFKIGIEYDGLYYHSSEIAEKREKAKEEKLRELGITLIRVKEVKNTRNHVLQNEIFLKIPYSDKNLKTMLIDLFGMINSLIDNTLIVNIDLSNDRNKIYERYINSEKENSLLKTNPKLAREWHPTKNGNLKPENLSAGSNKKVWWICQNGHEWQSTINSRNSGVGCPICSNKKVLVGFNDLATINPELAKEWHPTKNGDLTPRDVTPGSNKKVWWLGICGHEWQAQISDRFQGKSCPICIGKKVLVGFNDLATINPELAKEWHPTKNGDLTPKNTTVGSDKKVWWKCSVCGHEWQAHLYDRKNGKGCPVCAGKTILVGYNDLSTINPGLAKEWNYEKNGKLKPENVTTGSNKKVWWKCSVCGYEWQATIASRNSGRGCLECYKKNRKKK